MPSGLVHSVVALEKGRLVDVFTPMLGADGTPYTNTVLPEGARVGVVGARADARLRPAAALAWRGPRHYGWDLDYTPLERLTGGD